MKNKHIFTYSFLSFYFFKKTKIAKKGEQSSNRRVYDHYLPGMERIDVTHKLINLIIMGKQRKTKSQPSSLKNSVAKVTEIQSEGEEENYYYSVDSNVKKWYPIPGVQEDAVDSIQGVLDDEDFYCYLSGCVLGLEQNSTLSWKAKTPVSFLNLKGKGINALRSIGPLNYPNTMVTVAVDAIMLGWYRRHAGIEMRPASTQFLSKQSVDGYLARKIDSRRLSSFEQVVDLCRSLVNRCVSQQFENLLISDKFARDTAHEISVAYALPRNSMVTYHPPSVRSKDSMPAQTFTVRNMICEVKNMIFHVCYLLLITCVGC
jgi:hypothetical protein